MQTLQRTRAISSTRACHDAMRRLVGERGGAGTADEKGRFSIATAGPAAASRARQLAKADLVGEARELAGLAMAVSIRSGRCGIGAKTVREAACVAATVETGRGRTDDGPSAAMTMRLRLGACRRPLAGVEVGRVGSGRRVVGRAGSAKVVEGDARTALEGGAAVCDVRRPLCGRERVDALSVGEGSRAEAESVRTTRGRPRS